MIQDMPVPYKSRILYNVTRGNYRTKITRENLAAHGRKANPIKKYLLLQFILSTPVFTPAKGKKYIFRHGIPLPVVLLGSWCSCASPSCSRQDERSAGHWDLLASFSWTPATPDGHTGRALQDAGNKGAAFSRLRAVQPEEPDNRGPYRACFTRCHHSSRQDPGNLRNPGCTGEFRGFFVGNRPLFPSICPGIPHETFRYPDFRTIPGFSLH
jgi:hypothetical protein